MPRPDTRLGDLTEPPTAGAPTRSTVERWEILDLAAIGACMLLAAVVGAVGLGSKEPTLDEIDTWYVVSGGFSEMADIIAAWDINSTPYFVGMWLWSQLGDSLAWMRAPSVVGWVVAIPVVAALGRRLFDRRVGLVSALLVATSGSVLPHAQEMRGYTFALALAALASLLFLRAEEAASTPAWAAYVVGVAALATTHLFGLLVVAGHAGWLLVDQPSRIRRPERGLIGAGVAIALFSVPLAIAVYGQHGSYDGSDTLKPWEPGTYAHVAEFWSGGARLSALLLLIPFAAVLVHLARIRSGDATTGTSSEWFVVVGVAVPLALLAAASVDRSLLDTRYLIVVLPSFVVLVARGLTLLPRLVSVPVLLVVVLASLGAMATWLRSEPNELFVDLGAHVVANAQPDDRITFLESYDRLGILYSARDLPPESLPVLVSAEQLDPPAWRGDTMTGDPIAATDGHRMWIVARSEDGELVPEHLEAIEGWEQAGFSVDFVEESPHRILFEVDDRSS
jgi:mannosyltransferase